MNLREEEPQSVLVMNDDEARAGLSHPYHIKRSSAPLPTIICSTHSLLIIIDEGKNLHVKARIETLKCIPTRCALPVQSQKSLLWCSKCGFFEKSQPFLKTVKRSEFQDPKQTIGLLCFLVFYQLLKWFSMFLPQKSQKKEFQVLLKPSSSSVLFGHFLAISRARLSLASRWV